ncbi:SRPBCC family protein [Ornithinimicrobium panacihumi]|uniref:SRPBCC family protein n=1 Tax=Ornithinimicrobium panacihumi TaxID=2008449 RepID=UPI003F88A1A8
MSTSIDITELVVTQQVPAPVDQVWAAWTSAEGWATWWWPQWEDTEYAVDARPGGTYLARSMEGDAGVTGEFTLLEAPHTLEMTWRWDGEDAEDVVRVELTEADGGTLVTVRHRTGTDGVENYRMGWEFVLSNLVSTGPASTSPAGPAVAVRDRVATLAGPTLRIEQLVDASAGSVFDAWLDPQRLATWWWPDNPDTTFEVDPREGGRFAIRSASLGLGATGTYLVLHRPHILAMTWAWESDRGVGPEDVVEVEFTEVGDAQTLVLLAHHMAEPTDDLSNPEHGWREVLGNL